MNTQYTPGPWRIGTPPPNGEQTIGALNGLMVAVATTGVEMEVTEANARLIAAAPELLEALQSVLENCLDSEGLCAAHAKARAAIAKATGGAA